MKRYKGKIRIEGELYNFETGQTTNELLYVKNFQGKLETVITLGWYLDLQHQLQKIPIRILLPVQEIEN